MAAWFSVGSLSISTDQSAAVALDNGRVLQMGGNVGGTHLSAVCQLYNPSTRAWTPTGSMHESRSNAMAVLLHDGRVFVCGGSSGDTISSVRSSAEIFDANTGLWTAQGSMSVPRVMAGIWLLNDGRVLVAGGTSGGGAAPFPFSGPSLATAEIFDPNTGLWTSTGSMNVARHMFGYAMAGTIPVGVGGVSTTTTAITSTEVYDVGGAIWSVGGTCTVPGTANDGFNNCVGLNDGRVLLASGRTIYYGIGDDTANCALYDAGLDTWTTTTSLIQKRDEGQLFKLQDGRVLMAGGFTTNDTVFLTQCELFDPGLETWTATASMPDGKAAIFINVGPVLNTGEALIAGGFSAATMGTSTATQIYTSGAPPMAITLLQHKLTSSGGHTVTLDNPTSSGSLILVYGVGLASCSDNVNGAYTLVPSSASADAVMYYFANSASGATVITVTGNYNVAVSEWSGIKTASPLETSAVLNNVSGGTPTAASVTTANAGDLLATFVVDDPAHAITAVSSGWTMLDYDASATSTLAYRIPGTTGTFAAQFTLTGGTSGFNTTATAFFPVVTGASAKQKASSFLVI